MRQLGIDKARKPGLAQRGGDRLGTDRIYELIFKSGQADVACLLSPLCLDK